jgi:uncharacterized protein YyaL (SSP411 family)
MAVAQKRFLPNRALLFKPGGEAGQRLAGLAPFTAEMKPGKDGPAAYVCRDFACRQPVSSPAGLAEALA